MSRHSYKNIRNIITLIESAPIASLRSILVWPIAASLNSASAATDTMLRVSALEAARTIPDASILEFEATRINTLFSARGAELMQVAADQLAFADEAALESFRNQPDTLGRAIWLRIYAEDVFSRIESLYQADHYRGMPKMYEAFEIRDEKLPAFKWTDEVRGKLETIINEKLQLDEPCEIVHVEMEDARNDPAGPILLHYLIVRHAGPTTSVWAMQNRRRKPIYYHPALEATIIYDRGRRTVEVFARDRDKRPEIAEAFSQAGFDRPLSDKPLTRLRYNLGRFRRPLGDALPQVAGGRLLRLWVEEMTVGLGNSRHRITLRVFGDGCIHDVAGKHLGASNPFSEISWISRVVLVMDVLFDGETVARKLPVVFSEPNRCNLKNQEDARLRVFGERVLTVLGVLQQVATDEGLEDGTILGSALRLLEQPETRIDAFTLARMGIDIEALVKDGMLVEGEHLEEVIVEIEPADGDIRVVKARVDWLSGQGSFAHPVTGVRESLPEALVRNFRVERDWLRERVLDMLAGLLKLPGGDPDEEEPVFLGEITINGGRVPIYLASRLGHDRHYNRADIKLRREGGAPGIALTTTASGVREFVGRCIVVPLADVIATGEGGRPTIDAEKIAIRYRRGRSLAVASATVDLIQSGDGHTATLVIPGKDPWSVTGHKQIMILRRLVDAHRSGNTAVAVKDLMDGTGCDSPQQAFRKDSPWRDYIEKVRGVRGAWRLNTQASVGTSDPVGEDEPC